MAQNIYDNPEFFADYSQLPRQVQGGRRARVARHPGDVARFARQTRGRSRLGVVRDAEAGRGAPIGSPRAC
ncbi:SAM-dependent methyltransferase [Pandoraea horticolens]|uniref:SAM-dependent methyltransferase n=1 Tax=Pandoraea horticolens TaxID=2508298 RepID=A0A5E4VUP3_9BURK|nr:SAM-dependent methyltransferase [Pandoraea horticolens]